MSGAVIDQIDWRQIRIGRHWLTNLAWCKYLGFDLEPEIIRITAHAEIGQVCTKGSCPRGDLNPHALDGH